MRIHRVQWLVVLLALTVAGCDQEKPVIKAPAETWVSQKWKTWPQIVLTNDAKFKGHTPMKGASSFLIKSSDGRVFGVTAKHLLGEDGGVSPELDVTRFNNVLTSWRLAPRTKERSFVKVDKLVAFGKRKDDDWLVFSLKPQSNLPAVPLRVRGTPVADEEQVYLLGCPYSDDDCMQNVHAGHVYRTYQQEIIFDFEPKVDLSGFSGAPVIDGNGHLVGILKGKWGFKYAVAQNALEIYKWLESSGGGSGR
jgi:hypothetical protein